MNEIVYNEHKELSSLHGKKLSDVIPFVKDGIEIYVGSMSGYFFIGTKEDYARDKELLDSRVLYEPEIDERKITQAYVLFYGGIALIVEGEEIGACWTKREYEGKIGTYRLSNVRE